MEKFYGRCVFFVKDGERSLDYYTNRLGFSLDWNYQEEGRAYVFQVSLFGLEVIINQVGPQTESRAGHGRVFAGLNGEQAEALDQHIKKLGIESSIIDWGAPTIVIRDPEGNELFFTPPQATK